SFSRRSSSILAVSSARSPRAAITDAGRHRQTHARRSVHAASSGRSAHSLPLRFRSVRPNSLPFARPRADTLVVSDKRHYHTYGGSRPSDGAAFHAPSPGSDFATRFEYGAAPGSRRGVVELGVLTMAR